MQDEKQEEGESAASVRTVELVTAGLIFLFGAIVVFDSVRLGARWAEDGPQAGYFPFYVGLLVCLSAAVNFLMALVNRRDAGRDFVELDKLKLVLAVLVPAAVYVAAIGWIGIYVASAVFIAFFMRWLGKYPWWKVRSEERRVGEE